VTRYLAMRVELIGCDKIFGHKGGINGLVRRYLDMRVELIGCEKIF
jgi:hypothetical protein